MNAPNTDTTLGLTPSQITAAYIKLRDHKKEITKRHDEELAPINDMMRRLESAQLEHLNASGQNSFSGEAGKAFKVTKVNVGVEDAEALKAFCASIGRTDFFENRVAKSVVEEYVEAGNPLPPGLTVTQHVVVQFRK